MAVKELLSAYEATAPIRVRVRDLWDGHLYTEGTHYRIVAESKVDGLKVAGFFIECNRKEPVLIVEVW